jgi:PAS domain S-box-containing protein
MKNKTAAAAQGDSDEIAAWVLKLQEAQQRLQELTGGGIDAVLHPGGQSYLLQHAQEKLRQSEEQFRNMFNAAATGIAVSTPQGRFLQVNAAYCRMLGYTAEELLTRDFASLTHPDDLSHNLQIRDEVLSGERESFVMEKRYIQKNGNIMWTRHSVSATRGAGGEVLTFVVVAEDITERKQVEIALRNSEERLRLITNLVPHGIFAKDAAGRHIFANPALAELAGLSVEEMLGKDDFDLVANRAEAEAYRADDLAVIQSGKKMVIAEEPRTDLSGRTRFLQTIKIPFTVAETGEPAVLGVCLDITERKQAEEELRRQQNELQALFDLMPAMVWFKDRQNGILRINQRAAQATGKPVEEIEGKSMREIYPQEAAKYYADDLEVINSRAPKLGIIETLRNRDGQEIWVQTDKVPVFNKAGEVDGIVVMVQDITERKRNEGRIRRLVDSNIQGVFFWNTNGRILEANDAMLGMVGYTREDLKAGRISWAAMTPPEFSERDQRALEELAAKGICKPFEKEFLRKDGTRVPIFIGAAMFDDKPDDGVCFVLDLTERKKLEQQFLRAQRMESIGTLASGVAHDLNNILAPIIMSIELLKGMVNNPQGEQMLATIEASARQGADIVRQVLSFARGVDGERIEIQPKHLLQDLENIIKGTFPKNIQLEFRIPGDIWTVLGDPTQVHQVLLNLSVNARDAMPNGGSLTIEVVNRVLDEHYAAMNPQARAGRYVQINITDSGTGMPPEVIDKIFEPFFTTKEMGKGTGLGLSTVMAVVKSHEGIVTVYSELDRGTTFKVYLPAMDLPSDGQEKTTQQVSMPRGNGETVLIIDDEASILTITGQTLQAFGYRVLTATDGAEAVALYATRKDEIAVVLTDMMMPVMDGTATIRALNRINPAVKIIAASGLNANGTVAKVSEPSVKHFLTKPYTAGTLLKTLRTILEG